MGKHLKEFQTLAEYKDFKNSPDYIEPNTSWVVENTTVYHNYDKYEDEVKNEADEKKSKFSSEYMFFEAIEDCRFWLTDTENRFQYSFDKSEWVYLPHDAATPKVAAGDKIYIKCFGPLVSGDEGIGQFESSGKFNVKGNIMSLLYGDDFADKTDLTGENFVFSALFSNNTNLISAEELVLPAEKLSVGCYQSMFKGCTKLLSAPSLPAVTLAKYCYSNMFQNCFELSNIPELPVTTLEPNCYMNMFNGCASIVASPLLPASVLVESCYSGMFYNCSSLKEITMLATDNNANDCLTYWVYGVASEGTFYRNPEMDLLVSGVDGIPEGWTLIPGYQKPNDDESDLEDGTTLNEYFSFDAIEDGTFSFSQNDIMYNLNGNGWNALSAGKTTPLVSAGSRIYFKATNPKIANVEHEVPLGTISAKGGIGRFSATGKFNVRGNIMSLLYGDEFMGNIDLTDKNDVFYALFYNCTKIVNANNLILPATTMSVSGYQAMFMGCSSLLTAPELPATTLADHCYESMFWGCNRLLETPVLPATTVAVKCYQYMFRECTAIKKACDLPAVTLEDSCYEYMFYGCSNLEVAPVISATKLAYQCCWYMFAQCKSLKSAPALLSETLVSYSYASMFAGCSNLNEIKMYATNASAYNCLSGWVSGVASEGTFYRNPEMKSLSRGSNGIPQGWTLIPGDEGEMDDKDIAPIDNYFTLEAIEDCVFSFNTDVNVLQYSLNRKEWSNLTVGASTPTVNAGSKIYFKATNPYITEEYGMGTFCSTEKFVASGNIMSLWYAENFAGKTVLEADYVFKKLFATNKGITDASNLVLPATTLSQGCYQNMFDNCENLVNVPELPATTLANRCYDSMFKGCVSLVNAPKLHANRLADACYYYMFANCPNLIDAPELPATILTNDCYYGMFYDCISLVNAPKLPSISLMDKCYNNMFNGCVNLIKAPVLSASVLKNNCYENMFSGCSNLNEITMLATDASAYKCLSEWVSGVASEGTFYRSPEMDSLPRGINGIPAGWTLIPGEEDVLGIYFTFIPLEEGSFSITNTTNNIYYKIGANKWILLPPNTPTPLVSVGDKISFKMTNPVISKETGIGVFEATGRFDVNGNIMSLLYGDDFVDKTSMGNNTTVFACLFKNNTYLINASNLVLPATSLTESCYKSMFNGCTNLVSTPELPATKIPKHSYWSMFEGCSSLITTPELPATSLGNRCYQNMFFGCTNLISVPELPATNMAPYCYHCMFQNCTSLTVLPALPATTLQKGCYSGMFAGCTSLINASSLVLPAKKMVAFCYENMFDRCTNLISTPKLPATTLAEYCYTGMFNHCAIAIAPELPALVMSNNCYLDMFRDCTNLNEIKMYATNIAANNCLSNWVNGVASTGTFYRNPEMNSLPIGVNGIPEGWTIIPPYDEKEDNDVVGYLTFEAIENGTFSFAKNNIYYSLDEKVWHRLLADTSTPTVSAGSKIYFKASNPTISGSYGIGTFSSTGRFNASGNIMSMLYGDDFEGQTDLTGKKNAFVGLFNGAKIVDASELILPAAILESYCYQEMFKGCTSLTTAPSVLPAETLANGCYYSMFSGCTSLVIAPELPALTLADYCYYYMFKGCTSLTSAPTLPATTLANECYNGMFRNCTSLVNTPALPATTLKQSCYQSMFQGCTNLETTPALPAETLKSYCYMAMFSGCTSLTTAPSVLPATTLADSCYNSMFNGCTSLSKAPELPATTLRNYSYVNMFKGCSKLNEIKMYATDITAIYCLDNWVNGVASTGTFYRNPEMTSLPIGVNGIPEGWTIIPPYDEPVDYANEYLTFEVIEDGIFSLTNSENNIEYRIDNGEWTSLMHDTPTPAISAGSTVSFKAIPTSTSVGTFTSTGKFNVRGNAMSLIHGDDFEGQTVMNGKNLSSLFANCAGLIDASNMILPAKVVTSYASMFENCTSLLRVHDLGATGVDETPYAKECTFMNMFKGCTSLLEAPKMYNGESNDYPISYGSDYESMFEGCTSLTSVTMNIKMNGTGYWSTTQLGERGCYAMFRNCTSLKIASINLEVSTHNYSMAYMFAGCTSLVVPPQLDHLDFTYIMQYNYGSGGSEVRPLSGSCTHMFEGCTSLVNAPKLSRKTIGTSTYSYMFAGCTSLVTAPELPLTLLQSSCYSNMFNGCTSLVNAPELPATTLAEYCYSNMFNGCTSLVNAPELPATTLAKYCYQYMFNGCSKLNEIKMYATDISATYCLSNWVEGVASEGTFYRDPEMNSLPTGAYGIPEGWTIIPPYDEKEDEHVMGYLAFEAIEDTTFSFTRNAIHYSLDNGTTWNELPVGESTPTVNAGNEIYFKATNPTISSSYGIGTFSSTGRFNVSGNIMSMLYGDGFTGETDLRSKDYAFKNLFKNCTKLVDVSELILPATKLSYACYSDMFEDCTSLVNAPELPATTLANYCYNAMFHGCTSLINAPELPATTLVNYCYRYMFNGCPKLNNITMLATDISATDCLANWVDGVAEHGIFHHNSWLYSLEYGINGIPEGWDVTPGFSEKIMKYLTFEAVEDTTFSFSQNAIQYSVDGTNWNDLTADSSTPTVSAGSKIHFKRTNPTISTSYGIGTFSSTGRFNVSGNIMSMHYGDNFVGKTDLTGKNYAFYQLFKNCIKLEDVSELILPADTLAERCYYGMFAGCTNLVNTPELPATTLAYRCYSYMFKGCTSLVNAPELPATTLAEECYQYMFNGCTSLTTAPILPATTLAKSCYSHMFAGCTNLVNTPELPVTKLAQSCYSNMFNGCTNLTSAPELPAATLASTCYSYMFNGCTSLVNAPELPATKLAQSCYMYMFSGCTNLTTAPVLPAATLAEYCYQYMFNGCTSLVNAPELPATKLLEGCYCYMFNGCTSLVNAPALPATTLCNYSYEGMFYGCTSLVNAPELSATKLSYCSCKQMFSGCTNLITTPEFSAVEMREYSCDSMFYGCTSLVNAPALPATTLAYNCYSNMFNGCTSLVNAPALPAETLAPNCYSNMFNGCTSLVNAPELPATTLAQSCYMYMFYGCTSLVNAPALPATTLSEYCYQYMFNGCTSLVNAPELPATTLTYACYRYMFYRCTSLATAPALPATTLANYCYYYMFNGCTSLTTAPILPATTLANYCYSHMFAGCTNLVNTPELPVTKLATYCYQYMFANCTSLTTSPELPATKLLEGCYRQMFYGCPKLNNITMLATDISATNCLSSWVSGVASTGTFVKNSAMNSLPAGASGIPNKWTVKDYAESD